IRSVDVHLPEIEAVVHDRGLLPRRESRDAIRATLGDRMVVFHVDERALDLARDIRARAGGVVEQPPVALLLVGPVVAGGAQRRAKARLGENLVALPGGDIHAVHVPILTAVHHVAHIRTLVARDRGATLADLHGFVWIFRQPRDRVCADAPRGGRGARAIL